MSFSQAAAPLIAQLQKSAGHSGSAFHTPGHKQGRGASSLLRSLMGERALLADLPELPELDNLFAPNGVIREAQALAAELFQAEHTFFLANGSTCGVMAAIWATCGEGDKILLPRNIHQSAIAGCVVTGAQPVFLTPAYDSAQNLVGGVAAETVAEALVAHPDAKAVMILAPTYQGISPDIAEIAKRVHQYNISLLVDEAHGAHFGFHPRLPPRALDLGADLSIQSTHKTLSALTQGAMLHVKGDRIALNRLKTGLQLFQSTSPNYLILASLDAARQQLAMSRADEMAKALTLADFAHSQLAEIKSLAVVSLPSGISGFQSLDRTRLTVRFPGLSLDGFEIDDILHGQLGVTAELPLLDALTFILSLGNSEADIEKLLAAWQYLAQNYPGTRETGAQQPVSLQSFSLPEVTPRQALQKNTVSVHLLQAQDRISAELVCPYPPGIPVLLPGERITVDAIENLQTLKQQGCVVTGAQDESLKNLQVLA
ncbi:MAG: aminotransferase class I/II-fold pyridoxal phosphate-dependent enzyme [Cyanobacteria bacterium P01_H01_bin.15]